MSWRVFAFIMTIMLVMALAAIGKIVGENQHFRYLDNIGNVVILAGAAAISITILVTRGRSSGSSK